MHPDKVQVSHSMPISPARTIAFDALLRVETENAYASEILHARLNAKMNAKVSARDAALATEIVMGALRWQRLLDFLIARYIGKKAAALDPEVLIALRMGIYQTRYLARIPARAAVSDSVELIKRARKRSAASLVNAVLRRAATESARPIEEFVSQKLAPAETLALVHSHPTWLVERWLERFGRAKTVALLETNNAPPSRVCAVLDSENREEVIRSLVRAHVEFESGGLLRGAIIIRKGDVSTTNVFENGEIIFQDEASQMIPLLLGVNRGESVLDLCAAPGGKTMALARAAGPGALVVATDRRESRLRAMRERLKLPGAGASHVNMVALDATTSLPFRAEFDRILVDAPCSGTGTLARNPEIRWKLKPGDLVELHQRQVQLLRFALEHLAARGTLLYSTCSLEHEENEDVIREMLELHPEFRACSAEIPTHALAEGVRAETLIDASGAFRTFPPAQRTDGFFAAVLRRKQ
ncbi:MAG TPA: 16S rRNA (cytosine(967)-C(5))-methyltransferase RsmB [Candidatus Limnocylindrales bacterium]|nr:16S rRNA (cytosine(967)-C(5))-methyltransferase RsmB [Candidatus Limnocylindrales bacterium]